MSRTSLVLQYSKAIFVICCSRARVVLLCNGASNYLRSDVSSSPHTRTPQWVGQSRDWGPPPPNTTSNRRIQQSQAQVDEVVDVMRMNMEKVMERDTKLSELDDRADALQAGASQFETSAAKLKRKNWWKNCKMMIILGGVCAIILIIIIIYFCT